jgi:hypothetical protein
MGKFIDRSGSVYGRLLVLSRAGTSQSKKVLWNCRCECGNEVMVDACSLATGNTLSCGCYLKEKITKHGGWQKSSYNTWRAMVRRCTNQNDKDFHKYGGRGITVCAEWLEYTKFAADMGEPVGDQTLDRIDPYGDYNKENCRWASLTVQARNIRKPVRNKTGAIGVVQKAGKWVAQITHEKKKYSKAFKTFEDAVIGRKELERLYWGRA